MAADSQKQPVQPRDARIVSLILQSLGVEDYDPKVVHQLLEFAHRKIDLLICLWTCTLNHTMKQDTHQTYSKTRSSMQNMPANQIWI